MADTTERTDAIDYDILRRLREARRAFHVALTDKVEARERMFTPAHLLRTLSAHVDQVTTGTPREHCGRLFVLTVLLYGALDWHFAGHGIDIEADVQLERMRQNYRYGGRDADNRLSAEEWQARFKQQITRLEQHLAVEELYAMRLLKLTALAQAALESASNRLRSP